MIAPADNVHSSRPLNWLLERGWRVVFSSLFNPFPEGREGYSFIRFPYPRGERVFSKILGENIGHWLSTWTSVTRLWILRHQILPTITHVHWVDDRAYYCVKAGLRPLVLTVWGSDINDLFLPNASPVLRRQVGEALLEADLILIDSADLRGKCAALAGRKVLTELITLGVNVDLFHPGYSIAALEWRRRLGISTDTTVLLSMRGWSPLYRHESILEAFANALPRLNSEAVLVFKILKRVRTDREIYENKMRDLVEKLGISQKVRWMEEVPFNLLPEVYSFADVIINYPSMDAFPVTFLEAAACECPVISCRLPAYGGTFAEEYFDMVSPDDLSELSDAIVEFVNNQSATARGRLPELRKMMCRDYDEGVVAGRLLDIYQKLSSSP